MFWLYSMRKGSGLARGAVLFSIGSAVAAVLIGTLMYGEKIGRAEMAGIFVGLIAIVLISWSDLATLF
jgi:drug/metabolite transporter (DMT)-like permease